MSEERSLVGARNEIEEHLLEAAGNETEEHLPMAAGNESEEHLPVAAGNEIMENPQGTSMQQTQSQESTSRIDKLEKKGQDLEKEAFQLANFYCLFQGVIFTDIYSGSSESKCRFRWLPIGLSIVAGVLSLAAFATIVWKFIRASEGCSNRRGCMTCLKSLELFMISAFAIFFVGFFVMTLLGSIYMPCSGIYNDYYTRCAICPT